MSRARRCALVCFAACAMTAPLRAESGVPAPNPIASEAPAAPGARSAAELDEARRTFRSGVALAREGKLDDAVRELERSLALVPHAATHYNLGLAEFDRKHWVFARGHFLAALQRATESPEELDPATRRMTEERLVALETRVVEVHVEAPAAARISIDGRTPARRDTRERAEFWLPSNAAPGAAPADTSEFVLVLDPGRHAFALRYGDIERTFAIDEPEGGRSSLRVAPPQVVPASPAVSPPAPGAGAAPDPAPPAPQRRTTSPYALPAFGIAALGTVSTVVFGLLALDARRDLDRACPQPNQCSADTDAERAALTRYAILADVSLVVAVAGAAVGVYVTAFPPDASGSAGRAIVVAGAF